MKAKNFLALPIAAASFLALTFLFVFPAQAQDSPDEAADAAVEESDQAPEDVSWDDDNGPGPKHFGDRPDGRPPMRGDRPQMRPPRDGDRPGMNRPPMRGDRPRMEGDRPGREGDRSGNRPTMDRPPMGGPRDGFRMPGAGRPEGPRDDQNHGDMLPPPPPPAGPFQNWEKMEKYDPEFFKLLQQDAELDRQTRQLTMQYRQAVDEDSKAGIAAQLAETVAKHFDVRQKRRAMELERLEKELNRMKSLFEKRNSSRDKIIEQRLKELKGEEESLF